MSLDICPIRFGRAVCGELDQAERREWWLSNGLGAYAAGTLAGTLTRRYHGLLIAPVDPPLGRHLILAKADATLHDGDRSWPLFSNRWRGDVVAPEGYLSIESFELDGRMPVWRYACGEHRIECRIWLEHGAHTVHVAWRRIDVARADARALTLAVRLLINGRDHHGESRVWDFNPVIEPVQGAGQISELTVHERDRPQRGHGYRLHIRARGGALELDHTWHEHFDLIEERRRGLSPEDNHLCVAQARLTLHGTEWSGIIASLHADASPYLEESMRRFKARDTAVLKRARVQVPELRMAPDWVHRLVLAADDFIFERPLPGQPDGESVIAGYPWFGDWGRDTMIALPGLTLATGRFDSGRRILETFGRFIDGGMLPNVFPGNGQTPEYNTADAGLWYIEAWRAWVEAVRDVNALAAVFPRLAGIIDACRRGTRHGIGLDRADGLLRAGEPGVQVTWMDAKIGDWVVTPRIGKPVEINALWFNALTTMAAFAERLGRPAARYRVLAERARQGLQRYVRADGRGLADVLDGDPADARRVRPNQILAVSLAHCGFDAATQKRIVEVCAEALLCSGGLRSLAPDSDEYRGVYLGGVRERDSVYHQGTVWAWLLGHYALAEYRVSGDAAAAKARLEPIADHLCDAALGSVSEIFDGDAPHRPRGAPAQAWSVASVLQAWCQLERTAAAPPVSVLARQDSRLTAAQPR